MLSKRLPISLDANISNIQKFSFKYPKYDIPNIPKLNFSNIPKPNISIFLKPNYSNIPKPSNSNNQTPGIFSLWQPRGRGQWSGVGGTAHWPVSSRPPTSAQVFQHKNISTELSLAQAQVYQVLTKWKWAPALVYPVNILSQVKTAARKMWMVKNYFKDRS